MVWGRGAAAQLCASLFTVSYVTHRVFRKVVCVGERRKQQSLHPEQQNSTGAGTASCVEVQAETLLLVQTLTGSSGLWFLVAFRIKRLSLDLSNFFLLEETPFFFTRKCSVLGEHSGMDVLSLYCQHYHLVCVYVCVLLCLSLFPPPDIVIPSAFRPPRTRLRVCQGAAGSRPRAGDEGCDVLPRAGAPLRGTASSPRLATANGKAPCRKVFAAFVKECL